MRCRSLLLAGLVFGLIVAAPLPSTAQAQHPRGGFRHHHHGRAAGFGYGGGDWGSGVFWGGDSGSFSYYEGPPLAPGYYTPYASGYGIPFFDPYWAQPFVLPPLFLPAETIYGPQAMQRFMGVNQAPPALLGPALGAGGAAGGGFGVLAPGNPAQAGKPKARASNAEAQARARQFIGFGDQRFQEQKYAESYERYKKATAAAPDLADPWFRQGFAQLALGRYDAAAKAIKRGLSLNPDWPHSKFKSDEVYGKNQLAAQAHLEQLAAAAEEQPQNADLMFLLGVRLFFDGQPERASKFFDRAQDLAGGDHLTGFLRELAPQQAAVEDRGVEL